MLHDIDAFDKAYWSEMSEYIGCDIKDIIKITNKLEKEGKTKYGESQ